MPHDTTVSDYPVKGRWSGIQKTPGDSQAIGDGFGVFTVHAALLHTGNVLLFSGRTEGAGFLYDSWTWDPRTGTERGPQPINPSLGPQATWAQDNDIDLFCAHQVFLEDGRLLVVGGASGDSEGDAHGNASIHTFDPTSETWDKLSGTMAAGRWYPTAVVLPNGDVAVFSGRPNSGIVAQAEIMKSPNYTPQVIAGGNKPLPIYPGLHLVKGGKIFFTGTSWRYEISPDDTVSFRMTGAVQGVWEDYPDPANPTNKLEPSNPLREEGTSVLLPPAQEGRVLLIGGGHWQGGAQHVNAQPRSVEILETQGATPSWNNVDNMHYPRINVNAVILADGKVLILGGHSRHKFSHNANEHTLIAEIFDPEIALDPNNTADPFTDTGEMHRARMYHSVGLLLPDGRVFTAGGDDSHAPATTPGEPVPGDQKSYEVYEPPYIFRGLRPRISESPDTITYGKTFRVNTPSALSISEAALIRPMATTHHTDTEQRYVRLDLIGRGNGWLAMTAPDDPSVAPPGYYMLFIRAGEIPSEASFVLLL